MSIGGYKFVYGIGRVGRNGVFTRIQRSPSVFMNISEGGDGGRIGAVHGHMRHQRMAGLIVQLAVEDSKIHYQRIYVIGAKIAYGSPNVGHCYGGAVMFLCCYVFCAALCLSGLPVAECGVKYQFDKLLGYFLAYLILFFDE